MKKMMILASVAFAAAFANASNAVWGFNGYDYVGPNGEGYDSEMDMNLYSGGKAFLYLGVVTASDTAFDTSSATLIDSKGYDVDNWVYGQPNQTDYADVTSTAAGQAYSLIRVNKDVDNLADYEGAYVLRNDLTSTQGANPGTTVTYYAQFLDSNPIAQGDWKTMSAVPEPTSGLLLLLGVAGLALRRRRA